MQETHDRIARHSVYFDEVSGNRGVSIQFHSSKCLHYRNERTQTQIIGDNHALIAAGSWKNLMGQKEFFQKFDIFLNEIKQFGG